MERLRHWVQRQDPAFKKQFLDSSKDVTGRVNSCDFRKVGGRASVFVFFPEAGRLLCLTNALPRRGLGFPLSVPSQTEQVRPLSDGKGSSRPEVSAATRCPRGGWGGTGLQALAAGSALLGLSPQSGGRRAGKESGTCCGRWRAGGGRGRGVCIDFSESPVARPWPGSVSSCSGRHCTQ